MNHLKTPPYHHLSVLIRLKCFILNTTLTMYNSTQNVLKSTIYYNSFNLELALHPVITDSGQSATEVFIPFA